MPRNEKPEPSLDRFRPMTVIEILSRSMDIYRRNFLKWVCIAVPGALIGGLAFQSVWVYRYTEVGGPQVMEAGLLHIAMTAFQSLVVTAAGVVVISEGLLGQSISVGQAYSRVLRVLFPLTGALMLFTIAVCVGLTVFIAGIVVYVWFCLTAPVVMIEGEGGLGALKRSRVIVKGDFRKAFLVVVSFAIGQALVAVFSLLLSRLIGSFPGLTSLFSLLSICLTLLIEPFKVVSTTLLYYDLRIRKEGYNLQIMQEELAS